MIVRLFLFLGDVLLINAVFLLSFFIWYGKSIPKTNFQPYKDNFIFLTFVYLAAFAVCGVFRRRFRSYWEAFAKVVSGMFLGTLLGVALVYVFRAIWGKFPSGVFLISFPIGIIIIYAFNTMLLRLTGRLKKKIVIIGKDKVVEAFGNGPLVEKIYISSIDQILQHEDIDEIVICKRIPEDWQQNLFIYLLLKLKVSVVFSPAIYAELLSGNIEKKNALNYLATFLGRKSDCEEFFIRTLDILGSLAMLIVLSPLIAMVWLAIKIISGGSVLYKQERVTKDGRIFMLYKFKTMIEGAEKLTGPVLASRNDPRVTKIGRILRSTRIDEIPQLLNVLFGDMSLVGPRPERPFFVERHKALRESRLAVKPGLTGLAQIRTVYDIHPKHKVKYDYLYIQKRSLLLNLYIMLKTVPVILLRKGW